jgi:hypothetical protein
MEDPQHDQGEGWSKNKRAMDGVPESPIGSEAKKVP